MIQLKPVTKENIGACVRLKVAEDQSTFVAPNINSIAWAYVAPELTPYGIYDGDTLVGFLCTEIIPDNEDYDRYWVPRFMIGADFQRKGYGREGMMAAVEMLAKHEDCSRVRLSVVEDNSAAIEFYKSIGFVPPMNIWKKNVSWTTFSMGNRFGECRSRAHRPRRLL